MSAPILGFTGQYSFLSNFARCIIYDGENIYPTVEHAYQAQKSMKPAVRCLFTDVDLTPGQAKRLGRQITLDFPWWESCKLIIMLNILRQKFEQPRFRTQLVATGDAYLEETNSWGDIFWGVCNNEGQNHLGKLLMQVREELINA